MLPQTPKRYLATAVVLLIGLIAAMAFAPRASAHNVSNHVTIVVEQSAADASSAASENPPRTYVVTEATGSLPPSDQSCPDDGKSDTVGCCSHIGHCANGCFSVIGPQDAILPVVKGGPLLATLPQATTFGIVTIPNEPPPRFSI